jgi:hypothetical protein
MVATRVILWVNATTKAATGLRAAPYSSSTVSAARP